MVSRKKAAFRQPTHSACAEKPRHQQLSFQSREQRRLCGTKHIDGLDAADHILREYLSARRHSAQKRRHAHQRRVILDQSIDQSLNDGS